MEVELDLWSTRSNDPVDSILSDVDCLGDVADVDVDVDEFILAACSSSDAPMQDTDLVDHQQHLNHLNQLDQLNHINHLHHLDLNNNNHLNGHHHLNQHNEQSSYKQHQDDLTLNHHQHLHAIFDGPNQNHNQHQQQQSSSPSTMSFQQHQLQLQAHHQQKNNLMDQQQQRPLAQSHPNDCFNDLTNHHNQHLVSYDQLQDQHNNFDFLMERQYHQTLDQPNSMVTTTTSSSTINEQQLFQTNVAEPAASGNSSLVASRVDHCYILNNLVGANQSITTTSGAELNLSNPLGQLRQLAAGTTPTAATTGAQISTTAPGETTGVGSSTNQLLDRDQLQMLLESRPQPISCSLDESPLMAAIQSGGSQQTAAARGSKRRQANSTPATSAAAKKRTKQQVGDQQQKQQDTGDKKRAIPSTTTKSEPKLGADQSSSSGGGSKSLTRRNRKVAPGKKSLASGQIAQEPTTGQVSPTLSSGSSSGVSSLLSPSEDSNQSEPRRQSRKASPVSHSADQSVASSSDTPPTGFKVGLATNSNATAPAVRQRKQPAAKTPRRPTPSDTMGKSLASSSQI